jgi:hypothetical protein
MRPFLFPAFAYRACRLYADLHNHGLADPAHVATDSRGEVMLMVELNIAGYRFNHEIPNLRRRSLRPVRSSRRAIHWRIPQLRQSHAA